MKLTYDFTSFVYPSNLVYFLMRVLANTDNIVIIIRADLERVGVGYGIGPSITRARHREAPTKSLR